MSSSERSRAKFMLLVPMSLPSEPPGPGVLPAFSSARVRIETSDAVVSMM